MRAILSSRKPGTKVYFKVRYKPFMYIGTGLLTSILAVLRPTKVAAGHPKHKGLSTLLTKVPRVICYSVAASLDRQGKSKIAPLLCDSIKQHGVTASSEEYSAVWDARGRAWLQSKAKIWGRSQQPEVAFQTRVICLTPAW